MAAVFGEKRHTLRRSSPRSFCLSLSCLRFSKISGGGAPHTFGVPVTVGVLRSGEFAHVAANTVT